MRDQSAGRLAVWAIASAALVWCLAVPTLGAPAQVSPPKGGQETPLSPKSNEQVVTVQGCVHGRRLDPSVDSSDNGIVGLYPGTSFALKGNKELISQLRKQHDGHLEEVTGVVVIPRTRADDALLGGRQVGDKTRITVGTRTRQEGSVGPDLLQLTVQSFRHIANRCVAKR